VVISPPTFLTPRISLHKWRPFITNEIPLAVAPSIFSPKPKDLSAAPGAIIAAIYPTPSAPSVAQKSTELILSHKFPSATAFFTYTGKYSELTFSFKLLIDLIHSLLNAVSNPLPSSANGAATIPPTIPGNLAISALALTKALAVPAAVSPDNMLKPFNKGNKAASVMPHVIQVTDKDGVTKEYYGSKDAQDIKASSYKAATAIKETTMQAKLAPSLPVTYSDNTLKSKGFKEVKVRYNPDTDSYDVNFKTNEKSPREKVLTNIPSSEYMNIYYNLYK